MLVIEYYLHWIEIAKLGQLSANSVIAHTSSMFVRHEIPEVVISDNGVLFALESYAKFAKDYEFQRL